MQRNHTSNQVRLLIIASTFLGVYCLALTFAPAVRARSWDADLRWAHWVGYLVWLVGFGIVYHHSERHLQQKDPGLLPVVAFLSGWGLFTIWRLTGTFGLRQTIWLAVSLAVFTFGLRLPSDLSFLRRYKYLWLTSGLLLTALTLIFGTNPMGYGPRLWLGCCGIYLQPSEPLKLLLVIYLSAYLADWSRLLTLEHPTAPAPHRRIQVVPKLQILFPTLIMTSLAILLLLVQRDLGTAFIFIFIYSVMIYLATGWWWVPFASAGTLVGAGFLGYIVFDVIRLRVDAWLNPWLDPAGRSYQIVQSLLAVANGGIIGRGPGLGNPSLVPVAHSDFIFAAIAEEAGLVGVIGFLTLLGLLVHRGLRIALHAEDTFRRYLATGLTTFLIAQSVLIIGGNLRLLPLTGVTLPFVSYGGSSLLVSFVIILLLLHISTSPDPSHRLLSADPQPRMLPNLQSLIIQVSGFLLIALIAAGLVASWWGYIRGYDLLTRTDNPRRAIADRSVQRGSLLDRHGVPLAETTGKTGNFQRVVQYPTLGSVIGYNHPVYGQAGLEAGLDPFLRGVQGNDPFTIWWNHLLYGQPPPGLDIRLTLDIQLQQSADQLLAGHTGALLLINAENGEILVMTSYPTFDPNQLEDQWDNLIQDPQSPLLNRASQGRYPTGDLALQGFIQAVLPLADLDQLGLPLADTGYPDEATPLEIVLAAAVVSNTGSRPVPSIAQMMANPKDGWKLFGTLNKPSEIYNPQDASKLSRSMAVPETNIWQFVHTPDDQNLAWYVGGTTQSWSGLPMAIVLVLEEGDTSQAEEIGQRMLSTAMGSGLP